MGRVNTGAVPEKAVVVVRGKGGVGCNEDGAGLEKCGVAAKKKARSPRS